MDENYSRTWGWYVWNNLSVCLPRSQISTPAKQAKLIPWPNIEKPWTRLHINFCGPIYNYNFLVIINSTRIWLDCLQIKTTSAELTIQKLLKVFARFGISKLIVLDNATQFTSAVFQQFLKANGISHRTSAPYHPATNGAAESLVKAIKNANESLKMHYILNRFLYFYRNTQHTV